MGYEDEARAAFAKQLGAVSPPPPREAVQSVNPVGVAPPGVMVLPPVDVVSKGKPKARPSASGIPAGARLDLVAGDSLGGTSGAIKSQARKWGSGGFDIPLGYDRVSDADNASVDIPGIGKARILGLSAPPPPPSKADVARSKEERGNLADLATFEPASAPPTRSAGGGYGGGGMVPDRELWRVGPQVRGAVADADAKRAEAGKLGAKAVDEREESERGDALVAQSQLLEQQKHEEARQQTMEARAQEQQRALEHYQRNADELAAKAADTKIDAQHFWNQKSTGEKVLGILGLVLGGFAQGFRPGAPNPAAEMLDRAIQNDIEAQKANQSNARGAADHAQGLLGQAMQRFGDERMAETATHQAYLASVQAELGRMAAAQQGTAAGNRANDLRTQLADRQAELAKQHAQELNAMLQFSPAHAAGNGAPAMTKIDETRRVVLPDGTEVYAPTDVEGRAMRKQAGSVANIKALTDEAIKLRDDPKAFIPGTEANAKLKGIQAQLTFEVKNSAELGALSGPDMGLVHGVVGNVTSVMPGTSAQLKAAGDRAVSSLSRAAQANGLPVISSQITPNRRGEMVRQGGLTGQSYEQRARAHYSTLKNAGEQ